jgi:hypothetical protein
MFIEGLFARWVYRSLYKMHEAALHGGASVLWRTVVSTISQRPTPTVKLHKSPLVLAMLQRNIRFMNAGGSRRGCTDITARR